MPDNEKSEEYFKSLVSAWQKAAQFYYEKAENEKDQKFVIKQVERSIIELTRAINKRTINIRAKIVAKQPKGAKVIEPKAIECSPPLIMCPDGVTCVTDLMNCRTKKGG